MKRSKRLLCLLLAVLTVASVCGGLMTSASGYSFTEDKGKAYEVTDGVYYSEYTLSSAVYDNVYVSASALEFNTEDYAVIPYSGTAGGAAWLANQYRLATEDGYEVVAVINGSFFSMDSGSTPNGNYGYLNEYLVSNGEIFSADNDNLADDFDGMVCVNSDGTLTTVYDSKLHFNMYFNGKEIPGGVSYINKTAGRKNASNWGNGFYYFDEHAGDLYYDTTYGEWLSQALTFDICPGYEILCKKINGTKLTIDGTLEAEVISVTENTYGGKIGEDEFILFVKNGSPYASYAQSLQAGDSVTVSVSETGSGAAGVTANATSIIANTGYLVKDGVNLAAEDSFNSGAAHSNTTKARWTAFGVKADGSYVFFTTEGASTGSDGSVTLQDVASAMIEMGCVDVIRLDGGGSSAMYVCDDGTGNPGFKQKSSRSVGDCILVVKRTSPALQTGEELQASVLSLIEQAQTKSDDPYVSAALEYANSVVGNKKAVSGDYTLAYMKLRYALSGKNELGALMGEVAGVTFTDYSEYVLTNLRSAYAAASAVFGSNATAEEVQAAYDELNKWYQLSGNVTVDGKEYTVVDNGAYLTGLNLSILTGYCSIYTPGTDVSGVNLTWAQVILLKYDEKAGGYIVQKNFFGNGQKAMIMNLLGFENNIVSEGYLVIGAHGDSGSNAANRDLVKKEAAVGRMLVLYGIDLESNTTGVASYFAFTDVESPYATGDINGDGKVNSNDYIRLKRHILRTYTLTDEEYERADVDGDGKVIATDYIKVKRHILGTAKLD